jgi:hypothetical protein
MQYSSLRTALKAVYTFLAASMAVLVAVKTALPEDQASWDAGKWGYLMAAAFAAWRALENYRKNGGENGYPLWLWPWNKQITMGIIALMALSTVLAP